MKNSIVFIILCLCSLLSAVRGKCGMNMPNDNQCMSMTSKESMNNTYLLIQQGKYDNAYDTFIAGVDRNDETLGGFIFETIINGLRIFGYIKNFKIKDYGIPRASIDVIKNIDKADVISVFKAIYDIAHNKKQFANKSIAECFEIIKQRMSSNEDDISQVSGSKVQSGINSMLESSEIIYESGMRSNESMLQDDSNNGNENESSPMHIGSSQIEYSGSQEDRTNFEQDKRKRTANDVHPHGDGLPDPKRKINGEEIQK